MADVPASSRGLPRARTTQRKPRSQLDRSPHSGAPYSRLAYLPALDGLRALAVVAVLCYHADLDWARGGFLGVDVFFVISGYLITALLLGEWQEHGAINLFQFWLRRARRLLPAVFVLIIVVLVIAVVALPNELVRLRGDALAASVYLTNWWLIFAQRSYFESVGRPSLLQHLWSLAVEEQFYLVWPPLLALGLWRWPMRRVLVGIAALALISALLMAGMYHPGVDPSRVYYGSDTRAATLLVGVGLAFFWRPEETPWLGRLELLLLAVLGGLGLFGLGMLVVQAVPFQPAMYHGGFVLTALLAAAAIAAVVHPQARWLPALIGASPLRWLGRRSYSVYLWHWPVFMLTRPQLDLPFVGLPVVALRFGMTLLLAECSYRLVEMPVRNGALSRLWRRLRMAYAAGRWETLVYVGGGVAGIMAFTLIFGSALVRARPPMPPPYLSVDAVVISSGTAMPQTVPTAPVLPTILPTSVPPTIVPTLEPTALLAEAIPTEAPTAAPLPHVLAIGDSVMLGAAGVLTNSYGNIEVDAAVSRQASEGIAVLQARREQGALGDVVVVQFGNNGTFDAQEFDAMMQVLADVPRVIVLDIKVPRPWEESNNQVIRDGVARYPNTALVDWQSASADHPDFFWDDGIHLRPEGAAVYSDLILQQVQQ